MIVVNGASPNLENHLDAPPKLDVAADLLIAKEHELGRNGHDPSRSTIVRLPSPRRDLPGFFCSVVPDRARRLVNAGGPIGPGDPLSIDAVRKDGRSFFSVECLGLYLLMVYNTFGYAARCITWPTVADIEQSAAGSEAAPWAELLEVMLLISSALAGDIVAFNALAGNTQNRFHFVSHRPPTDVVGPYPLQLVAAAAPETARRSILHIGRAGEYPIDAWRFGFPQYRDSASAAAELIERWISTGGPFATVTVTAAAEEGNAVLYVLPRNRRLSPSGWPDMPAALEVMGAGVTSDARFVRRLRAGDWGYAQYWQFLASLRPHGVERLY